MRLSGDGGCHDFEQVCDIRDWLPGMHTEMLRISVSDDIPDGEYDLEIGILSPHSDIVYLATNAERHGGFYKVGKITIE